MEQSAGQPEALTVPEKVRLLQQVWPSLCSQPDSFSSPEWQADVLAERRQRLFDGSAKCLSWHDAKTQLQRLAE